jgi:bifunctional aspartokinase / homoserine dehydrogenase 1
VILLRELGIPIEPSGVSVEPLAATRNLISSGDARWHECADAAAARGNRLVYVASWRDGAASARVREIRADEPLARLRPGENIVLFRTARYDAVPLTIAGPGAGPEKTAAGLLAEILEVAGE